MIDLSVAVPGKSLKVPDPLRDHVPGQQPCTVSLETQSWNGTPSHADDRSHEKCPPPNINCLDSRVQNSGGRLDGFLDLSQFDAVPPRLNLPVRPTTKDDVPAFVVLTEISRRIAPSPCRIEDWTIRLSPVTW